MRLWLYYRFISKIHKGMRADAQYTNFLAFIDRVAARPSAQAITAKPKKAS